MNAGLTYLMNQTKKTNNDNTVNTVKALELKATNERIDKYEETIKELISKIEEQNDRITKLEELNVKGVLKELFPVLEENNTPKTKKVSKGKNIPVPQIGDNNLFNDTLTTVNVITKKIPGYIINEEQAEKINDNIKDKLKDKIKHIENDKIITLEEKKKRIKRSLDLMSRTIGLRLGNDNMIDLTVQALTKIKNVKSKIIK